MESEDTYQINGKPLKPHEYVIVRRVMTAADAAYVQNQSVLIDMSDKKNPQVQMVTGNARLATVKRMVVRWNLTRTVRGPDGQETQVPIELSEEAIERLPRRIFDFIHEQIDVLNGEDEEEADFSPAANGHSGGSLEQTNILQLKG